MEAKEISSNNGKNAYYIFYLILSIAWGFLVTFVNTQVASGFLMKLVGAIGGSVGGFLGFLIADFIRKLIIPDMIFTTGGFPRSVEGTPLLDVRTAVGRYRHRRHFFHELDRRNEVGSDHEQNEMDRTVPVARRAFTVRLAVNPATSRGRNLQARPNPPCIRLPKTS